MNENQSNDNAARDAGQIEEIQVTVTVHASIIHFKYGGSENVERGESVETALERHNEGVMMAARQRYMDGYGYGVATYQESEIRDILADDLAKDEDGELEAKIKAAVATYADEIPGSSSGFGFKFGDDAEDEDEICDNMELKWSEREAMEVRTVSYMIDSVEGHAKADHYANEIFRPSHSHLDGDESGVSDAYATEAYFDAEGYKLDEDDEDGAVAHVTVEIVEA